MEFPPQIPKDLISFLLVVLYSLLIGLEQRKLHIDDEPGSLFGTDRTITLIGILGFILYIVMPSSLILYFAGGLVLSAFLGIYYFNKIKLKNQWGFTSILITLMTYCLAPLVYQQPTWMVMSIVVAVLIVVEKKESFFTISRKFDSNEFTTLAKFIIIAGIILPLLPYTPISAVLSVSPYHIWMAIVAVSGISYVSYLLKKFVFPNSGIFVSAVLGGLYSSTAATIILAKKSNEENDDGNIPPGIIAATGMMYIRIFILAWIFNRDVAMRLAPYFAVFVLTGAAMIAWLRIKKPPHTERPATVNHIENPLEFRTALIFGLLFAFFAVLTNTVVSKYGNVGVNILSFIVGVTDIDPYILNLFQHTGGALDVGTVAGATIIATAGNNLVKMFYTIILGKHQIRKKVIIGFSALIAVSMLSIFL